MHAAVICLLLNSGCPLGVSVIFVFVKTMAQEFALVAWNVGTGTTHTEDKELSWSIVRKRDISGKQPYAIGQTRRVKWHKSSYSGELLAFAGESRMRFL